MLEEEHEEKMRAFLDNFKCYQCGKCCSGFSETRGVILFPDDINNIAEILCIREEDLKERLCYSVPINTQTRGLLHVFFLQYIDSKCIFLSNNKCTIYENRPIQCKKAPFNFFWTGKIDYDFNCIKNTVFVPENWSTWDDDVYLISQLLKQ